MTKMIRRRSVVAAGVLAVPALAAPMLARHGWAQSTYPNKQIRMVVPFAPAGTTDLLGRIAAAGIARAEWIGADTCADEALFYSNRRAELRGEGDYGRLMSAIMLTS